MKLYEVFSSTWEGSLWFTSKAAAYKCRNAYDHHPAIQRVTLLPPTKANLCKYLEGREYAVQAETIELEDGDDGTWCSPIQGVKEGVDQ